MDLALYKEFYDREWERHEHLQSAVNTPISIVSLLAGGLVLMGKGFESASPVLAWSFWIVSALATILVSTSVYFLIRCTTGYQDRRMPLPVQLALHHDRLKRFYRARGTPGLADSEFEAFLKEKYVAAADHNAVNNSNRSEYLNRANRYVVYALCATASAGLPAAIAVKMVSARPQEIRITNLRSDGRAILELRQAQRDTSGPGAGHHSIRPQ